MTPKETAKQSNGSPAHMSIPVAEGHVKLARRDFLYLAAGAAAPSSVSTLWGFDKDALNNASLRPRGADYGVDTSSKNSLCRIDVRRHMILATQYITKHISKEGRFDYIFDPLKPAASTRYNLLRHAGTTIELYRQVGSIADDGEVQSTASLAWSYLNNALTEASWPKGSLCVSEHGISKLGGAALTALALCVRLPHLAFDAKNGLDTLARLLSYVIAQQRQDGSFVNERYVVSGDEIEIASIYYPGQAVLSLCAGYQVTGDVELLRRAVNGARYLINEIPRSGGELEGLDAWTTMALAELCCIAPEPAWLRALERQLAILLGRIPTLTTVSLSGYKPATTRIATDLEALAAASNGLKSSLDKLCWLRLMSVAEGGLAICYERQIDQRHKLYKYEGALGGVTQEDESSAIRIDYVQHLLAASSRFYNWL
jgi:prenyltransferase beta subunit